MFVIMFDVQAYTMFHITFLGTLYGDCMRLMGQGEIRNKTV